MVSTLHAGIIFTKFEISTKLLIKFQKQGYLFTFTQSPNKTT